MGVPHQAVIATDVSMYVDMVRIYFTPPAMHHEHRGAAYPQKSVALPSLKLSHSSYGNLAQNYSYPGEYDAAYARRKGKKEKNDDEGTPRINNNVSIRETVLLKWTQPFMGAQRTRIMVSGRCIGWLCKIHLNSSMGWCIRLGENLSTAQPKLISSPRPLKKG